MTAIAGLGGYVPAHAVTSETIAEAWGRHEAAGIDRVAVADADEDALTMAWAAAVRALDAAERRPGDVAQLALATTTPPIEEEDLTARLASMLGTPSTTRQHYTVGSSRAGTDALLATAADGPWDDGVGLVVAADVPRGHPGESLGQAAGAGAAAVVLDRDGPGSIVARGHATRPAPGERFRRPTAATSDGLGVTAYDRAAFAGAVTEAVEAAGGTPDDIDAVALHARDGKRPYRLAADLGVTSEAIHRGTVVHDIGYTAAAGVLLGLANAVANGAEAVLVIGYGAGATADAIVLDVAGVPVAADLEATDELSYAAALRRRGELDGEVPEGGGAYVSLPTWQQSIRQRHRLEAGRCRVCDALAFPPTGACGSCGEAGGGYREVVLPGTGTVETVSTIAGGAPPEFDRYQSRVGSFQTAIVAFDAPDGDDTASAPAMVASSDTVAVGDRVQATVRRLYTQEGLPRYGIKVRAIE